MSRIQQTTLPQSQEVKKIFCAYHPTEFLTNFCCDAECLMPLCPNCIVEHTDQHFIQNNKPAYVNLLQAINDTKQKCYQHIVVFEELSKSNDKIYDYVMGLRESIHNQLMEDKQEIFKEIDLLFENYEEKLMNQTLNKYKQLEVYDRKETVNISDFITQQIEILHEQIGQLKSENCLAALITYYKQDGKVYEDSIKEISDYISKHRKAGKISINGDPQKLTKTLESFCEGNLSVQFISEDMIKQKQQQNKLKNSNLSKEGSKVLSHKLSQKIQTMMESTKKENNNNLSNQEYRNNRRSEDYFKIDPLQLKYNKSQSSNIIGNSYYQKQFGSKSRFY